MIKRLDINISISSVPHKHIQTISTCAPVLMIFVVFIRHVSWLQSLARNKERYLDNNHLIVATSNNQASLRVEPCTC